MGAEGGASPTIKCADVEITDLFKMFILSKNLMGKVKGEDELPHRRMPEEHKFQSEKLK